jgi:hypothetical protein
MLSLLSAQVDATFQICINNKCEMVSDYDGYQNKKNASMKIAVQIYQQQAQ